MKNFVAYIPVVFAVSLSACHPQEASSPVDSKPDVLENADSLIPVDTTAREEVKQVAKEVDMPAADLNWSFFYKDRRTPEILDKYKRALKIVVDQADMHGTMDNVSRRIGDWFVIGINDDKRDDPELKVTDAPDVDHVFTYVVDLANGKVIAQNDFAALRPLFNALDLIHRKPLDSANEQKFLNSLAALVASVANKHWRFVEPMEGQSYPNGVGAPELEIKGDTAIFTFFISGGGMASSFTKNQLTIAPAEITFNAEIVMPE